MKIGWTNSLGRALRQGDRMANNRAEVLAHVVVARFMRLYTTYLVGGPRHQDESALLARIPAVRPAHPHEPVARLFDVGRMPGFPAVDADLHLIDGARAAPGIPADHVDTMRHLLFIVTWLSNDGLHADSSDQFFVG